MGGAPGLNLPRLEVVPAASVVLHEEADERRVASMVQRLQADSLVKNPPIVAPLDDGRYVVLDGANRTTALWRLGVPDMVVQIVDYGDVSLSTWYHLVTGAAEDALARLATIPGIAVQPAELNQARRSLEQREILAFIAAPDSKVLCLAEDRRGLQSGSGSLAVPPAALVRQTALLRRTVATYKGLANIQRVQTDSMAELAPLYDDIAMLVVFPTYTPADIMALAKTEEKLPTGITRHLIPRRALRVNTEIDFLWSEAPLAEKQRWLAEWTRHRLQARAIRFYEESTFLYDE